jgi:hypothetical protein
MTSKLSLRLSRHSFCLEPFLRATDGTANRFVFTLIYPKQARDERAAAER